MGAGVFLTGGVLVFAAAGAFCTKVSVELVSVVFVVSVAKFAASGAGSVVFFVSVGGVVTVFSTRGVAGLLLASGAVKATGLDWVSSVGMGVLAELNSAAGAAGLSSSVGIKADSASS